MLPLRRFGEGSSLVALHGFTSTGRQFESLAPALDRRVIAPDLPGHGGASHATTAWPVVVDQISDLLGSSPVPVVGYSQGARLALAAAVGGAATPPSMVLISGTAGIDSDEERADRAERDRERAMRILDIGLDAFLDEWTSTGITSTERVGADIRSADRAVRADNTAEGLASALIGYGQGAMPPLWDRLESVERPTLVVAGSEDAKYVEIAERLHGRISTCECVIIEGAGHNPLLDRPIETVAAVSDFLDRNG